LSLLKVLAKITIAAAIPAPIARATFHNTHGSFFFQKKKIHLQDHPLFDLPCEFLFFLNLKKSPIGVGCGGYLGYGGKWQQLPWLLWLGHLIVVTQTMFTLHVR
jgi:hypothetical protein